MVILLKVIQVIFALSLMVLIHEFGHYLFSKMFGIRVEKFYLFFDIGNFALFKFKPKKSDTEYGIGWLPLGGYCKISGMVDESMDLEAMKSEPQPWEFRTHPAWQRFLVMFGGVFFNLILAIVIFSADLHVWGEQYLKNENAVYGIATNDLSYELGFRDGDRILDFDGHTTDNFSMLQADMVRSMAKKATVLRGGNTLTLYLGEDYIGRALNSAGMFDVAIPFVVAEVPDTSVNATAGLLPGDRVMSVNGKEMSIAQVIRKEFLACSGDTILLGIERSGMACTLPVAVDGNGMIGVLLDNDLTHFFDVTTNRYSFFGSIPAGIRKACHTLVDYVKELGLIFTPKTEAYKSVGSFIRIGQIFPSSWDWHRFWSITAWLSIMLAVLNILPIPGLDGGHILFLIIEVITRKKPSDKAMEVAQVIGMIILCALMVLAFGNDIASLFK